MVTSLVLAVIAASAWAADIALVRGTYAEAQKAADSASTYAYSDIIADALTTAGLEFDRLGDEDVAAGKLAGYRIAIFAYSPLWAPGEADALAAFVQNGGKAMVFYTAPTEVLGVLGFRATGYQRDDGTGLFHACQAAPDASVEGLPPEFVQDSWNINGAEPARDDARVLYFWRPRGGQATGQPAILLSDGGLYMTHVLTRNDLGKKARMLFAVVAHFIPGLWPQAAQRALDQALVFDAFRGLEELESLVRRAGSRANNPQPALDRTRQAYERLRAAVEDGHYAEAVEMVEAVRAAATETYARCQQPRPVETRAVWIHTAFGVADWGWQKSIRHLKDKGFNAIFPNMCWGGVAYYDSDVLPVHESVKERGDQVAECLKWCRRYGVELHVWKVNWNLGGDRTPAWFWEKLRAEGRLQRDPTGKEIGWLCPTDDRNFALERDAMLELARKYRVDGIHFDYIRYPGYEGCYCDRCREKFQQRIGQKVENWPEDVLSGPWRAEWLQFRRDNITPLVKAVAEEVHRSYPRVKVSAAVWGWWESARDSVGQDWVLWVDRGWLDFACPMDYIPANDALDRIVTKQVQWIGGRIPLYVGIGEWILKDGAHLIYQATLARERGADGFVLFHYDHPELTGERMDMMALGVTREPAIWPHRGPRVDWVLPPGMEELAPRTYLE
ncbi:MAG: family 10 glycosylhydrolase, partial [Armatimonadetes bacterium]|nr:family 10 glycosylhydrolase [Armatimonadota bacterium]